MTIRTPLLLLATGFMGVLAPGGSVASAAETHPSEITSLELGVWLPGDDPGRPEPEAEPKVATPDSGPEVTAPGEVVEVDPWAGTIEESVGLNPLAPDLGDYPVVMNDDVRYFLDRFTGSRRIVVELWMSRSGRYLAMIQEVFRNQGLPTDLAFTAMIESGFNPRAVSRVGAKGLWQFMAPTARRYGLRVDRWVDERLDPEKSTVAAAAYLRDLYTQFGSWALAQAAYNAGEVKVMRAIQKTGSRDFWTLAQSRHLRRGTEEVVPQIHAATVIGRDPDRYGFDFDEVDPVTFDTLTVPPATDLRRLAATAGLAPGDVRALNPTLVRGVTPPGGPWTLRLPAGERERVAAALVPRRAPGMAGNKHVEVSHAAATGDVHVVRPRDTVSAIARQYGVSVGDVMRWNRLDSLDRIRPGDRLRVAGVRSAADR